MREKRFLESLAIYGISKIIMLFGTALALVGSGLSFGKFLYYGFIYSQIHDDSSWYIAISSVGYWKEDTAFFPMYPALLAVIHAVSGISVEVAGLLVSNVFFVLDIYVLLILFRRIAGHKTGTMGVLLWAVFPMSVYLSSLYTESLFVFGIAGTMLALLDKKYTQAALFAALACLTRNTGVLLVIPFLMSLWADYRAKGTIPKRGLLSMVLLPVPLGLFFLYLWVKFGNPLIWDTVQKLWGRESMFPLFTLYHAVVSIPYLWEHTGSYARMYYLLQYGAVLLSIAALPTVYKHLPRSWFWMMVAQIIVPLCDPGIGVQTVTLYDRHILDYFFSFDRFTITFLPLFLALAIRIKSIKLPSLLPFWGYAVGLSCCGSVAMSLHMFLG